MDKVNMDLIPTPRNICRITYFKSVYKQDNVTIQNYKCLEKEISDITFKSDIR